MHALGARRLCRSRPSTSNIGTIGNTARAACRADAQRLLRCVCRAAARGKFDFDRASAACAVACVLAEHDPPCRARRNIRLRRRSDRARAPHTRSRQARLRSSLRPPTRTLARRRPRAPPLHRPLSAIRREAAARFARKIPGFGVRQMIRDATRPRVRRRCATSVAAAHCCIVRRISALRRTIDMLERSRVSPSQLQIECARLPHPPLVASARGARIGRFHVTAVANKTRCRNRS
jgi:hypothetical protein